MWRRNMHPVPRPDHFPGLRIRFSGQRAFVLQCGGDIRYMLQRYGLVNAIEKMNVMELMCNHQL